MYNLIELGLVPPIKVFLSSHPLLYARIPGNWLKVQQFGILFPIPQLAFEGKKVKE
jgi:hypothetical protein